MPFIPPTLYWKEPFRSLYLAFALFTTVVFRIPSWIVFSLPGLRPRKSWSFSKSVHLKILRYFLGLSGSVGPLVKVPDYLDIPNDLKPNVKGVWIDGVPDDFITGELQTYATIANVKPARIPGYWYHRKGDPVLASTPASEDEKVIFLLHGGAYVGQSAHPSDVTQNVTRGMLDALPGLKRALSLEYRLSKGRPFYEPVHPFPTALVDTLTGYYYLVHVVGFKPKNIIPVGDSAGANLALALTRYLRDTALPSLPPPGALLLHSPWVDLGASHIVSGGSIDAFVDTDYVGDLAGPRNSISYAARAITQPFGEEMASVNPYISPASKDLPPEVLKNLFTGFPKTLIISGEAEQLIDSIRTLHKRMEADMGSDLVQSVEMKDAFHDFLAFPWAQPERYEALQVVAAWFSTL